MRKPQRPRRKRGVVFTKPPKTAILKLLIKPKAHGQSRALLIVHGFYIPPNQYFTLARQMRIHSWS